MRLASFIVNSKQTFGFVRADGYLVEMSEAWQAAGLDRNAAPDSMLALIEAGDSLQDELARAWQAAAQATPAHAPETVRWLPPVVRPSKVIGVACNNRAITARAKFCSNHPMFFLKAPSSLVGHLEPVVMRAEYGLTHPEAELAVVIGKKVKDVTTETAMAAVFGYTIMNDVTSVSLKSGDTIVFPNPNPGANPPPPGYEHGDRHLTYHLRSKSTDTFGPCGPWIVTKDEIPNPDQLGVKVFMGDELCMEDNTASLTFSVAQVVAFLSRYMTLEPGDIVHVGTAATGKYHYRDLDFQEWDGPCHIEIEGIGRLSSPIQRV